MACRWTARSCASSRSSWPTASPTSGSSSTLSRWQGKKATLESTALPEDSQGAGVHHAGRRVPGAADLYRETLRPQFHFSPRRGWNNDPNGHGLLQGRVSPLTSSTIRTAGTGATCTGATPSARTWCTGRNCRSPSIRTSSATGSSPAAPSWTRTTRPASRQGDEDVIVAAYTSTGRGECIVYSNDRGRTFTIRGQPGREAQRPRPEAHLVRAGQALGDGRLRRDARIAADRLLHLDGPEDVDVQSRIEGFFECPEIFELPVDGDKAQDKRWVVYAADGSTRSAVRRQDVHARARASTSSTRATASTPRRRSTTCPTAGASRSAGVRSRCRACRSTSDVVPLRADAAHDGRRPPHVRRAHPGTPGAAQNQACSREQTALAPGQPVTVPTG